MNWISVEERFPEQDCTCIVWNKSRPFQYYISHYSKHFNEFDVYMVGSFIRLPDAITFHATHWMPIPEPPTEL